jgi:hypothetical protein
MVLVDVCAVVVLTTGHLYKVNQHIFSVFCIDYIHLYHQDACGAFRHVLR